MPCRGCNATQGTALQGCKSLTQSTAGKTQDSAGQRRKDGSRMYMADRHRIYADGTDGSVVITHKWSNVTTVWKAGTAQARKWNRQKALFRARAQANYRA